VDDKTRDKVEFLIREFDRFIHDNHETGAPEDNSILKEWGNFKNAIEKNPTDIESHNAFVNSIGEDEKEDTKSNHSSLKGIRNTNSSIRSRKNIKADSPYEIDKIKLKRSARELIDSISRSNK